MENENDCCRTCSCAKKSIPDANGKPWVIGYTGTPGREVPLTTGEISFLDTLGTIKMRLALGRGGYRVDPGLYALGSPDGDSPVLVTANYKMSFDVLRKAMAGRNAWILVLDTKGINVWCAAGKGTFGTGELIRQIAETGLDEIVRHKDLVVPQLGAPGVAAHIIKKETGFRVHYGPIRARDIPRYLDEGMKASPEMRAITFTLAERLILAPVELMGSLKVTLASCAAAFLLGGMSLHGFSTEQALSLGSWGVFLYLAGLFIGAVLVPALLPYIPGRAFSLKGYIAGMAVAGIFMALAQKGALASLSSLLIIGATSSFFAMNFTGATPFTSLSGVKREMKLAVPIQIITIMIGIALWKITG
jgi:hypothetical protein